MCIGSNSVNQAQDLMFVTKFEDFPNSLIPNRKMLKIMWQTLTLELLNCDTFY